jgi:hypothetical protein
MSSKGSTSASPPSGRVSSLIKKVSDEISAAFRDTEELDDLAITSATASAAFGFASAAISHYSHNIKKQGAQMDELSSLVGDFLSLSKDPQELDKLAANFKTTSIIIGAGAGIVALRSKRIKDQDA